MKVKMFSIGAAAMTCILSLAIAGCGKQNEVSLFGIQFNKTPAKELVDSMRDDSEAQDDDGIVRLPEEIRWIAAIPVNASEEAVKEFAAKYNKDELAEFIESGWRVTAWFNAKDAFKPFRVKAKLKIEDGESVTAKFDEIRKTLGERYGAPLRTVSKGDSKFCLWTIDGIHIVVTGNFGGYARLYVYGFVNDDSESCRGVAEVFGKEGGTDK